jgi:hypothetical protein
MIATAQRRRRPRAEQNPAYRLVRHTNFDFAPGNAILLNGGFRDANREISVPRIPHIQLAPNIKVYPKFRLESQEQESAVYRECLDGNVEPFSEASSRES